MRRVVNDWKQDPMQTPYHSYEPALFHLAQLFRKAGDIASAESIESDLRRLLPDADRDLPMFAALNRTQQP